MKITRRQLRRIIMNEMRLNEKALDDSLDTAAMKGIDKRALAALEDALEKAEDNADIGQSKRAQLNDDDYEDLKKMFADVIATAKRAGNTDIAKEDSETHSHFYSLASRIIRAGESSLDKTAVRLEAEKMLK